MPDTKGETAQERFERLAESFYDETGMIAPGKDVPAEMGDSPPYKIRHMVWQGWLLAHSVVDSISVDNSVHAQISALENELARMRGIFGDQDYTPKTWEECNAIWDKMRQKWIDAEDRGFTAYQVLSARTIKRAPGQELTYHEEASNFALGLAGESGEVADLIKKQLYHSQHIDSDKLVKELGDVLWYVAALCTINGLSMYHVANTNILKLKARHPGEGFDPSYHANADLNK